MSATVLSGKELAKKMRAQLAQEVQILQEKGITPGLTVILVGQDPASQSYVKAKGRACSEIGIRGRDIKLPEDTSQESLLNHIDTLNEDPSVHGILVQLPLPPHIDTDKVIQRISPDKDVDGFHPVNLGKMVLGKKTFLPCTPHGVIKMLEAAGIDIPGKNIVIMGRSNIVGKPLAVMLMQKGPLANATVTVCHTKTKNLKAHTLEADIIVAAVGRPEVLTADMVKEGAIIIDVGVNRVEDPQAGRGYRLVGDVDFSEVKEKAAFITPVPGGVGPMTITMLLFNTVESAQKGL